MRILHVISTLSSTGGGPPVALEGLAPEQVRHGLRIGIASTYFQHDELSRADRLRGLGVSVELIGPVKTALHLSPQTTPTLQRLIADADLVHIHGMWEQVQHVAARLTHRQRKPSIIRPCGMLDPWSLAQSRWKKRAMLALRVRTNLQRASALHFTTATERDLTAALRLSTPAIIEPNGVNLAEVLQPVPDALRLQHRYPALAGRPIVLFLARLHPKKGTDLLIDAFDAVLKNWPTDRPRPALVIVGNDEGSYRATLEADVLQKGIQGDVLFTGPLTGVDKAAVYQSADLYCLPSHQENFGISVVEAAAAGLPVLISDQVNIYQEVTAAGVGESFPLTLPAIEHTLRRWLTDTTLSLQAGPRASTWARDTYAWSDIARRWALDHYPRLIAESAARR